MPSFDVSSEMNWAELDNAINQAQREIQNRFDFKGVTTEITLDRKAGTITFLCGVEEKLDSLVDLFQGKCIKRGISILSFESKDPEPASGRAVRQVMLVQNGISKEKGKEIIQSIKEAKFKVQAQIQDEKVRVTAKSRDELQTVIGHLKQKQDSLKVPLQFGNYRD